MYIISCINLFSLTSCLLLFYIATHTSLEMAPLQRSKSASQTGQLQIQHFIHQHVLHKLYMTSEFNCDGCNTGGYGVRYRCSACDFDLHEQCATTPHRISANIHPHHHLALVNRPGDSHLCHISGDKSLTLDPCQLPVVGGFSGGSNNNQPVLMNQQMQSNSQPMMVNHHQQMPGIQTMQFGGYNGSNTSQPMMINHHQQQQMKPIVGYGSFHGVNNNNSQPMMVNHHQQQQQQGYPGGMNSQPVMVNNHHQQQVMPTNQQFVTNQHQQLQQQQGMGIPATAVGGYNVVHNNQTVMIHHPPPPPPQQSSGYTKVGKLAANLISTSLIGVPIFMPKR
ncbi:putative Zinc finger, ZZ-type superfamily [Helianthus annuus]|nr:putative Zinc finger, ZZ-type superfamily [Helianthus annuus]